MIYHAFHNRIESSLTSTKIYFLVWWMTWAPKFLPTTQFHPLPFLSIYIFKCFESSLSCLSFFNYSLRMFTKYSFTFSISSSSISVALILISTFGYWDIAYNYNYELKKISKVWRSRIAMEKRSHQIGSHRKAKKRFQ